MQQRSADYCKPDHVPENLVYDFDYLTPPGHEEDIHMAWYRLRCEGVPDIFWTPRYGGHWIATRADDIDHIQLDHTLFSMCDITVPRGSSTFRGYPLEIDPPEHAKYRILLAPRFGPRQAREMVDAVRAYANELIDGFVDRGECEFVGEFANRLPIDVFLRLVDLPLEDRDHLLKIAEMGTHAKTTEERAQAARDLGAYVEKWIEERRANPGDDLFSLIVNAQIDGRAYNDEETYGMLFIVLFGGLDTVASSMGFVANFLATHPEHRQQLVSDPSLIPDAIEEFLRRFGIPQTARVITADIEYNGVQLKAGEQIMLPKVLHGLDERRYPDPLTVDFSRKPKDHAAFGAGPHKCLGMHLARQELRVFLEEWLRRIPNFSIKSGETPKTTGGSTNGMIYLPLVW